jgi:hypothetical protein
MKRRTEIPFIIGLCMVSMLAFSSSLFMEGANGAALKHDLGTEWTRVSEATNGWMRGLKWTSDAKSQATPTDAQAAATKDSVPTKPASSSTTDTSAASSKWTKQDIQRLSDIANELMSSMTQKDWTEAAGSIANDKPAAAEATLAGLLVSHLKPTDLAWLQQHFTGSASFGLDDVTLLQKTLAQAAAELTPQELSLVKLGLAKYAASQLDTAQ